MRSSIQLTEAQKSRLNNHKLHPRETYADVIERALDVLEEDELELSASAQAEVKAARNAIRRGEGMTTEEVRKELGL